MRYEKDYPNNYLKPEEALQEILKYFWLCEKHFMDIKDDPHNEMLKFNYSIHDEMNEMDDMWHSFLLFTQDYADFLSIFF